MAIGGLLPVSEGIQTVFDGSTLGASYKVYTYEAGTSTPLSTYPTYDDAVAQTNANANPTIADSDGRVTMWGSGTVAYKVVVKTDQDVTVKTIDDAYIMPGATTVTSKTPSEYQIAFYENVSGSYTLTNAQTEDTYDFSYASGGITLGAGKKFFFRDSAISVNSADDGHLDFNADVSFDFNGATDTDIVLNFTATTNSGVLTWMEDEDYFKFSDDILMDSTEKLYLRDTAISVHSSSDTQLDLTADGSIQFNIGSDTFSFAGASTTLGSNSFNFGIGTGTSVAFTFNTDTTDCTITWDDTVDLLIVNQNTSITGTLATTAGDNWDLNDYSAGTPAADTGAVRVDINGTTYYLKASTSAPT